MNDIADIIKDLKPIHYWIAGGLGFWIGTNIAEYESAIRWSQENHNTSLIYYRRIRKEETGKSRPNEILYYLGAPGREVAILYLVNHGRK
jgi:hypothetical protein